jgi:transcriptional antiterminator NusG
MTDVNDSGAEQQRAEQQPAEQEADAVITEETPIVDIATEDAASEDAASEDVASEDVASEDVVAAASEDVVEAASEAPAPPPPSPATKKPEVDPPDATPPMDWYILKVAFNREDSIADALRKRVKMEGMSEFFEEIYVPTEDVATFTRDGKKRISKRKLLPGYIMVRMMINDDTWFLVRETNGISDFTGAAGKPMPMEPSDVERFITKPDEDDEEEPQIKIGIPYKVGDRVRVKEGNFENQEGDVDAVDEANGRVTVIINIFGRSVPMELDHWQVESL